MAIQQGSSRRGIRNSDGSFRIMCSDCGKYISDSYVQLGKVRCALCAKALAGEAVPADDIQMYNAGKMGMRDVSVLHVQDDPTIAGEKFSLRSLTGQIAHAIGFGRRDDTPLESVKVSKSKRRQRLFADIDLDSQPNSLGSMQEVDQNLEAAKEK
jgi:hypothetical protein